LASVFGNGKKDNQQTSPDGEKEVVSYNSTGLLCFVCF